MKINFLGTSGWYDDENALTSCVVIETKKFNLIIDAGTGIFRAGKYIKNKKPIYLFLSHLHLDHIYGVHSFFGFAPKQGITIFTSKGTKKELDKIVCPPFTIAFKDLDFPVKVVEIEEGKNNVPFEFDCLKLNHIDYTLGYSFNLDGKKIVYCCDTGPCENVLKLAKDADALIHECTLKCGEVDKEWGHCGPEISARVAKKVNAKKLILTHFAPISYPNLKARLKSLKSAQSIFKNTFIAYDKKSISI